jgi:ketosteroid isomerase-like protein
MEALERMAAERACERLVNLYANRIDAYDYDGFASLFAEDAVLDMLGTEHRGLEGIRRFLEGRDRTMICRHLVTNVVIDVSDPDNATGCAYTIAYRVLNARGKAPARFEPPQFLVDYSDVFRRDLRRGWLFARRKATSQLQRVIG